ncbi:hypothetical protein GUJ93_ZPchr0011g27974 [Zizania palustris]|uniref:Mannose-6-phosphate isomerase n=1 Tax=Zizania palustris TaxID=103762 RepID=A0A8J5WFP7_ZIZPA|nr:hypothetical protein GUJ93_ZPchr0011g27974 [Zizania palustris]
MASSTTASSQMGLGLGIGLGKAIGHGMLVPSETEAEAQPDMARGVLRLRGAVQHYEWGRRGDDSLVARLAGGGDDGDRRPYAELWMGTHPSAPSSLAASGESLREWLARRGPAALLGRAVAARWGGDLPFLFKVLSVAKALSIQAHPDRELARALHALRPATYRDDNHKPEMAVAVTEFRALCGFVRIQELKDVLRTVPEVRELVGKEEAAKLMAAKEHDGGIGVRPYLQSAFTKLMTASKETVSEAVSKLKSRLNVESKNFPEILRGVPVQAHVTRYTPPSEEFEVDRCLLPPGESVTMSPVPGPSIFLVMTGEGEIEADSMLDEGRAKEGDVFFVPAHTEVRIVCSGPGSMQLYRAGVNSGFFS